MRHRENRVLFVENAACAPPDRGRRLEARPQGSCARSLVIAAGARIQRKRRNASFAQAVACGKRPFRLFPLFLPTCFASALWPCLRRRPTRPPGRFRLPTFGGKKRHMASFVPGAMVQITPALRASGLLLSLPAEELRSLLLILTFVHPNGHIQPTLLELAQALRLSQGATRTRMRRLETLPVAGQAAPARAATGERPACLRALAAPPPHRTRAASATAGEQSCSRCQSGRTGGRHRPQPRHVRPSARRSGGRDRASQRLALAVQVARAGAGGAAAEGAADAATTLPTPLPIQQPPQPPDQPSSPSLTPSPMNPDSQSQHHASRSTGRPAQRTADAGRSLPSMWSACSPATRRTRYASRSNGCPCAMPTAPPGCSWRPLNTTMSRPS